MLVEIRPVVSKMRRVTNMTSPLCVHIIQFLQTACNVVAV